MIHNTADHERYRKAGESSPLPSEIGDLIRFCCAAPRAESVYLVGDFNEWNSTSHPMEPWLKGWWSIQVPLLPGRHYYRFLVNGKAMLDPHAEEFARDEHDGKVSVINIV